MLYKFNYNTYYIKYQLNGLTCIRQTCVCDTSLIGQHEYYLYYFYKNILSETVVFILYYNMTGDL